MINASFAFVEEVKAPTQMKIPEEIQRQMLDFFMRTSIPRKKSRSTQVYPKEGDENENSDLSSCFFQRASKAWVFNWSTRG